MSPLSPVCLSLAPNLRCVGFSLAQSEVLIIPPVLEAALSLFFIRSYSGPDGWTPILLATDSFLYFLWALLDMLSQVVPAARTSLSIFQALDVFVGTVSFTPILIYSIYLCRLSFREFIHTLPLKLRPYLRISLPILMVMAVAINEVASFVGTHVSALSPVQPPVTDFSNDDESLWLSLSRFSLALYTVFQFPFFLLALSRLARAFVDRRRIRLPQYRDEHHFFRGIAWITVGIIVGVIETLAGFVQSSFGLALARRILRSLARAILMFGLFKGLDIAETSENLTDDLRGASRLSRGISHMLGFDSQRTSVFRRISPSCPDQSHADYLSQKRQVKDQHVTVHYEKGQAPFLQLRFSALDFPPQAFLADMFSQRRRVLSGLNPGYASAGGSTQQLGENVGAEMAAARNAVLAAPRPKSALALTGGGSSVPPDWIRPPERIHARQNTERIISDSMAIVLDLERRFPNLPPRVTGKYRGSILGQSYEEDPFPVVGVSRKSGAPENGSAQNTSKEGGASVSLSPSGSIKRKPAPPLLENIAYISNWRNRPASSWGELTQNTVKYPADSPERHNSPCHGATADSSTPGRTDESIAPRSRRTTARDLVKRASRALSDASIRSAEWLASTNSSQSGRTALTVMDIEVYRRGGAGLISDVGNAASLSGENINSRSADGARVSSKSSRPRITTPTSIGRAPMRTERESGDEHALSSHGSANIQDEAQSQGARRATLIPGQ